MPSNMSPALNFIQRCKIQIQSAYFHHNKLIKTENCPKFEKKPFQYLTISKFGLDIAKSRQRYEIQPSPTYWKQFEQQQQQRKKKSATENVIRRWSATNNNKKKTANPIQYMYISV